MGIKALATAVALGVLALAGAAQRGGQGHGRHRHADEIFGALDRRRRQYGQDACKPRATRPTCNTPTTTSRPSSSQVENMITKKEKVLVIAAIDGTTLSDALQQAADAGIKIISYDRLIVGSPNVDYYATFDNFQVGVEQATTIVQGLGIDKGKTGPFNIELFGGSADDNNAFFFYNGAMSRAAAADRQGHAGRRSPSRWAWTRSRPCAGTPPPRSRAWRTCSPPITPRSTSTRCCRPMTASRSASSRR